MKNPEVIVGRENAPPKHSRRAFLQGSGLATGAALVSGTTLAAFAAHSARAQDFDHLGRHEKPHDSLIAPRSDYGKLQPVPDQNGNTVLALPPDFRYVTFSATGDRLSDGNICPCNHDGMTCIDWRGSRVRLIRNHEVRSRPASPIRGRSRWAVQPERATTRWGLQELSRWNSILPANA